MRHLNSTSAGLEELLPLERKLLQRMAADKKLAALKRLLLETSYVQGRGDPSDARGLQI